MEDITLALITLTSFVLLFVVAIFADRAGMSSDANAAQDSVLVPLDDTIAAAGMVPARVAAPRADAADVA